MNLPDVNEMYPQTEPDEYEKCINCGDQTYVGDGVYEAAGYIYCSTNCFALLALIEGNLISRVAEGI